MARLVTLKADKSLWAESHYKTHHQASTFNSYLKQYYPLNVLPFKHTQHNLKFKVTCRVRDKEIENLIEAQKKVNRFRAIEELDQKEGLVKTLEDEFGEGKGDKSAGFEWNWPPLKNIPQRYKLIGTTSLAFVICNMDKVNLSVAIIPMSHQFGWNSSTAGLVQSSFFWGYALSQLPGGWLAKIFGGRKVLEVGVLAWSLATALVPFLAGYMPGLVASRILVGMGEGVSPSAATDLIARHVNTTGRTLTGSIICFWRLEFWKCYGVTISCVTCSEELSLNLTEAAWVSVLPPLASIFVTSIAAQLADYLITKGVDTTRVRKTCQTISFLSPASCMILSSLDLGLPPWEVVTILTGGLALSSFALSGLYCTHQDISPEYASILLGITNTVGAVPGIVGVALTGYLLDSTHSWSMSLFAPSIFFYLTGTVVWLTFASSKPQTFSKRD
ncbi:unnamed protein product [Coffea canephora]|uniref:Major facilitator superfamily (MFS) profile domain-containing protein n=1 Tax=Coffea canephora TaxID=49390 RepID=A0A068UQE2_COFCA|nr:unnamed protein product [Coffea canephora]